MTGLALTPTIESEFEGILLVNHFSRVRIVIVLSPGHPLSEVESESGFMQKLGERSLVLFEHGTS